MPRVNLLIADDVGLGKTIEAGLVAQELILRQRVRRILIVCPSSLQIQWREQIRDKFGLDFRIVDSNLMKDLRRRRGIHVNPWNHFPRLITSIDFLKRDRPLRLFREVLPNSGESIYPRRFDLLIVNEAHNVAPSGGGNYAIDSMRTNAIRLIEPHFEHKLFLSATPHNGYLESFTALLELLDHQRFARGVTPDREQLKTIIILTREEGLTKTYNRFHNPEETAADIQTLRKLHIEMDNAVAAAYGWQDLDLGHGFHETKQGLRYTISEPARREVLDRLLQLNHQRYAEEVAAGLHDKGKKGKANSSKKTKNKSSPGQINLL